MSPARLALFGLPAFLLALQEKSLVLLLLYSIVAIALVLTRKFLAFTWINVSLFKILSHISSILIAVIVLFSSAYGLIYGAIANQIYVVLPAAFGVGVVIAGGIVMLLWLILHPFLISRLSLRQISIGFNVSLIRGVSLALLVMLGSFFYGVGGVAMALVWYFLMIILR